MVAARAAHDEPMAEDRDTVVAATRIDAVETAAVIEALVCPSADQHIVTAPGRDLREPADSVALAALTVRSGVAQVDAQRPCARAVVEAALAATVKHVSIDCAHAVAVADVVSAAAAVESSRPPPPTSESPRRPPLTKSFPGPPESLPDPPGAQDVVARAAQQARIPLCDGQAIASGTAPCGCREVPAEAQLRGVVPVAEVQIGLRRGSPQTTASALVSGSPPPR